MDQRIGVTIASQVIGLCTMKNQYKQEVGQ